MMANSYVQRLGATSRAMKSEDIETSTSVSEDDKCNISATMKRRIASLFPQRIRQIVRTLWGSTYAEDGLITTRFTDFLYTARFENAYGAGKSTGSWGAMDLRWRVFVACWAAEHATSLSGDFVECGVNRGGTSRAVMEYVDFADCDKRFYLLDTFCGIPAKMKRTAADVDFSYSECYEDVRKTFSMFPNARIIRGQVPETLSDIDADQIAYLSLDMNCVEPEIAAAEFFWDKISAGGVILLDDYCYSSHYRLQNIAFGEFARSRDIQILALPTGQGLIIKPSNAHETHVERQ
jgi:O-methyltransferase